MFFFLTKFSLWATCDPADWVIYYESRSEHLGIDGSILFQSKRFLGQISAHAAWARTIQPGMMLGNYCFTITLVYYLVIEEALSMLSHIALDKTLGLTERHSEI